MEKKKVTAKALKKKTYRNYRRVWVHGYFRKVYLYIPKGNKEIKKKVRRWIKPHWRKQTILK